MERELADSLIAAWHRDGSIYVAVCGGLLAVGIMPDHEEIAKRFPYTLNGKAKAWFADHLSIANHQLWDQVSDDVVAKLLMRTRPDKRRRRSGISELVNEIRKARRNRGTTKFIRARALDRSHDWKTVK